MADSSDQSGERNKPNIPSTKDEQIALLTTSLEAAEAHIRLLKNETNTAREKEVLLEQLARAYCQLQNAYGAHAWPDKYESDVREMGAWVNSLVDAVGEDIYKVVLDRSYQLDDLKYGTKVGCDVWIKSFLKLR